MLVLGVVLIGGTLATLGLGFAHAPPGKKYALLVGVNHYEHAKLPALTYAEADVTDLAQVLRQGGYQVTLLTGAAPDQAHRPTRANIEKQLQNVLRGCRRGDMVLLAFAGHGLQFEKQKPGDPDDAFFCPMDARPFRDETNTLLSLSKVYSELDRSFAGMKVLLVDACRDDPDASRGARGVNADSAPRPPHGVAALFSCRAGERAFEHEKLGHGVFFYHVLEGLRGKARDADGEVTFAGLAAYVSRRVAREVPALVGGGARQSPNLKADYSTEPVLVASSDLQGVAADRPVPLRAPFDQAKARAAQQAWARSLGRKVEEVLDLGDGISLEVMLIPPGTFTMGSLENEKDRDDDEQAHEVTLTKPFYLGKHEITQEQYRQVAGTNPSWYAAGDGDRANVGSQDTRRFPVERVSWEDAQVFCVKLARKTGRAARLPTEAEWEYACRAGTATPYHFGTALNGDKANCDGKSPYGTPMPGPRLGRSCAVGSYRESANAFGLHDMHGNVWEWCADGYAPYGTGPQRDPAGPAKAQRYVLRGGSWEGEAVSCRSAFRVGGLPGDRFRDQGFRVALSVEARK
jgi:formylglycine-generating enzyme required for sulfatase activity